MTDATADISLELTSAQDFGRELIARAHLRQLTRGHQPEFDPISGHGDPGAGPEFEIIEWELLDDQGNPLLVSEHTRGIPDRHILQLLLGSDFPELESKAHQIATGEWTPGPPEPKLVRDARALNAEYQLWKVRDQSGKRAARVLDLVARLRAEIRQIAQSVNTSQR